MKQFRLLPSQEKYLSQIDKLVQPEWYNGQHILQVPISVTEEIADKAILALINNHAGFRARMKKSEEGWVQTVDEKWNTLPLYSYDFSTMPDEEMDNSIKSTYHKHMETFSLEGEKLIKFLFFKGNKTALCNYISVIAHHLVFDLITVKILYNELFTGIQHLLNNQPITLKPERTTLEEYIHHLQEYTDTTVYKQEASYWNSIEWHKIASIPIDYPQNKDKNTLYSYKTVTQSVNKETIKALQKNNISKLGITTIDALTIILSQAIAVWANSDVIDIEVLHHGRTILPKSKNINIIRTTGWFSISQVLVLKNRAHETIYEILEKGTKEMNMTPSKGIGHQLLSYFHSNTEIRKKMLSFKEPPAVMVNYKGAPAVSMPEGYCLIHKWDKEYANPNTTLPNYIICNINEDSTSYCIEWNYSTLIHKRETIEQLSDCFYQLITNPSK